MRDLRNEIKQSYPDNDFKIIQYGSRSNIGENIELYIKVVSKKSLFEIFTIYPIRKNKWTEYNPSLYVVYRNKPNWILKVYDENNSNTTA